MALVDSDRWSQGIKDTCSQTETLARHWLTSHLCLVNYTEMNRCAQGLIEKYVCLDWLRLTGGSQILLEQSNTVNISRGVGVGLIKEWWAADLDYMIPCQVSSVLC